MAGGFRPDTDRNKVDALEKKLGDIIDSQIFSDSGNDQSSVFGGFGARNAAHGDAGGNRSSTPSIHTLTKTNTPAGEISVRTQNIIVDHATDTTLNLYWLDDSQKDGQIVKIKPKDTKTLVLKSGGNIDISADVIISDTEYGEVVFWEDADPAGTGKWLVIKSGSGGGGGGLSEPFILNFVTDTPVTLPTKTQIDASTKNVHVITLDRNIEIEIINPPASGKWELLHLEIIQNATGNFTILWPANVNGTPNHDLPALSETTISLYTVNAGVTWKYVSTRGGAVGFAGATKALDNLVLPVLNTNINFNSNAPTNFNGYTSQIVGTTLVNDATGATWTLPSGDVYLYNINGISKFEISAGTINVKDTSLAQYIGWTSGVGQTEVVSASGVSHTLPVGDTYDWNIDGNQELVVSNVGLAIRSSLMFNDSMADPTTNGEIQRNGADVKVFTGGSVLNLSSLSGDEFLDNVFRIKDDIDDTRKLAIQTGGIATSTTRTWTAQNANGVVALLDSGTDQIFSDTVRPSTNGTKDWGDSTHYLNQLFSEQITLSSTSGPALSTTAYITADSSNMIHNVPTGDEYVWKIANTTHMQWTRDTNGRLFIRSGTAKEMGFVVSTSNIVVGTSGSIEIPVDGGSVGNAAAADTDFGNSVGCIGLYLNTIGTGNPTLCIKIDDGTGTDNRWSATTINRTTGALTGGILT